MRASPLLLLLLLTACAAQSAPAGGGGDPSCADANDLLAACAEDESMCGEALGVLAERCSGGKADGIELRGVQVTRVGGRTHFKMPLAYLPVEDRRRLQDEMITRFIGEMGQLNRTFIERGIDLRLNLDDATHSELNQGYNDVLSRSVSQTMEDGMEIRLGESYGEPRELSMWQSYVVPQAFIAYFGAAFTLNWGAGGSVYATVLLVIQPFLSVAVDHTAAEPVVVSKDVELDVAILVAPGLSVGAGAGGGFPLHFGVGAVFGPMERPTDLTGWAIGLSGAISLPVIGGGHAKIVAVLRRPPLFLAMLGYRSGTSAGGELHGTIKRLLDPSEFIDWLGSRSEPEPEEPPAEEPPPEE